jgi:hypothetical protein
MDDYDISSLHQSKNEWGSRLITILTPLVVEGFRSIFDEAVVLCRNNNENDKYLMTFQNFISRIPKWNPVIIETERKRIIEKSGCQYLEDLITCVHIIQLKLLTAIRVGQKQKKININIPKLDDFIHKMYIHVARRVYKNVYLFEVGIPPLQTQKNMRELEILVQEGIMNTLRESVPVEAILQAYMDETTEEDIVEEIKEQIVEEDITEKDKKTAIVDELTSSKEKEDNTEDTSYVKQLESEPIFYKKEDNDSLSFPELPPASDFEDTGRGVKFDNQVSVKDFERNVEEKAATVFEKKTNDMFEYGSSDPSSDKLTIFNDTVNLDNLDIHVIDPPSFNLKDVTLLDDIEVLA